MNINSKAFNFQDRFKLQVDKDYEYELLVLQELQNLNEDIAASNLPMNMIQPEINSGLCRELNSNFDPQTMVIGSLRFKFMLICSQTFNSKTFVLNGALVQKETFLKNYEY